jgi:hypothetical protein
MTTDKQACFIVGCNKPRHDGKRRCLEHLREYERERQKASRHNRRATLPPRNVIVSFPDLLVVEKSDDGGLGTVILYQATKIIPPDEARRVYGDSSRITYTDKHIILRAKIKPKDGK